MASWGSLVAELREQPLAPVRWSVEKKRRDCDQELQEFREKQRKRLKYIRQQAQVKVAQLHEKIFTTMLWSNPRLPSTYRKLVLEYCDHLMGPLPESPFSKWNVLVAWQKKFECSPEAKVTSELQFLLERMNQLVLKRDETLVKTLVNIEETTEKMTIAKEGSIKWHMEHMPNKRDEYWTIWYLSKTGKVEELKRLLSSHLDVDERDPDFGYTALHYACRWNQSQSFDILLEAGANILLSIPEDLRTPLHLASAYGTREMVLELLARGADYNGLDAHGCTALDLALQNQNISVATTLKNWVHLIPPDLVQQEQVEEHQDIPEEYLSTPYEVLLTMSPPLRVITTRLEGVGKTHCLESDLPLDVELRLCEKRAEMCYAEGFKKEALKSKKRRWSSAKREYTKCLRIEMANESVVGPSFLASICVDLYGSLMLEKEYLAAMKILSDGLITLQSERIRGKNARIYMITRYCELLLYFFDHRTTPNVGCEAQLCDDEYELRYGDYKRGEYENNEENKTHVFEMSEQEAVQLIANTTPSTGLPLFPLLQTKQSVPRLVSPNQFHLSAPASLISLPPLLSHTNSFQETNHITTSLTFNQNANEISHGVLLRRMEECLREAISLNEDIYTESDSFVESVTLAPLLELYSDCFDRQGDYELALHHRLHAATVKERTLGQNHAETVSCFIDCLRLTVRKNFILAKQHRLEQEALREKEKEGMSKYALAHLVEKEIEMLPEDKKNFSLVGLQATEVSRRIDKLNQTDHDAALRLAGRCYQLVALTDLIVAGELDPTKSTGLTDHTINRKKMPLKPSPKVLPSTNLSLGSMRYFQSLAGRDLKNLPTVSFNLLDHTVFSESHLLKRRVAPNF